MRKGKRIRYFSAEDSQNEVVADLDWVIQDRPTVIAHCMNSSLVHRVSVFVNRR